MDFYKYKLHSYSNMEKEDLPLEERMIRAKFSAEEQAQREYERIKESYAQAFASSPVQGHFGSVPSGRMTAAVYQDLLVAASRNLATIQGQSVEEFFTELQRQETIALESYADKKLGEYTTATTKLIKLNGNKGISAKLTNLFGQGESVREGLTGEIELLTQQYTVAQDSLSGWSYMTGEEKAEYLIGRIEVDHLASFDEKGMDNFGVNLEIMRKDIESSQGPAFDNPPSLEE